MAIAKKTDVARPQWYGDTPPEHTHGLDVWRGHDGAATWSDGGAAEAAVSASAERLSDGIREMIEQMRLDISQDMADVVGEQVKDALAEYTSTANFQVGMVDGKVMIGCEMANDQASIKPMVPMVNLLALAQRAAHEDPQFCEAFLRSMQAVLQTLVQSRPVTAQRAAANVVPGRTTATRAVVSPPKPKAPAGKSGAKSAVAGDAVPLLGSTAMVPVLSVTDQNGAFSGDDFGLAMPARR